MADLIAGSVLTNVQAAAPIAAAGAKALALYHTGKRMYEQYAGEEPEGAKRHRWANDDELESDEKLIIRNASHGPLGNVSPLEQQQKLRLRKYFDRFSGIGFTRSSWAFAFQSPTTGTGNQLFSPVRGVQINEREGLCCRVYKIVCNVDWYIIPVDATQAEDVGSENVRFALVQDNQWNGTGFTATEPWNNNHIHAFQSLTNLGRFRICKSTIEKAEQKPYDHTGTAFLMGRDFRSTTITWKPKKPVDVTFTNIDTETADSIQNVNWGLLIIGQVSDIDIYYQANVRVYFKDC